MTLAYRTPTHRMGDSGWQRMLSRVVAWLQRWPVAVSLIVMLASLPTLSYPIGWDQSVYGYVGHAITLGMAPYRDAWGQNAPGGYYLYAFAFELLGTSVTTVYILSMAGAVAGTCACFSIGRRLIGGAAAPACGLIFGLTAVYSVDFLHYAEPELFMAAFSALAVFLTLHAVDRLQSATRAQRCGGDALLIFAGVVVAVTATLKPTGAVFIVVPALICSGSVRKPCRRSIRMLIDLSAGFCLALLAVSICFAMLGILSDVWEAVFGFNGSYFLFARSPATMSWLAVKGFATSTVLGVTIPLSLGAVWIVFRSRNRRMEPIAIWGLLALGVVVVQFRFYQYHWLYALPASAVLSVVAVQRLMNTRVPRLRLALLIAYSVFSFLPLQVARLERDVPYFLGLESREQFLQHFHSDGDPVFATNPLADSDAADFIKSSLAPKDLVYAWNRPVVQFLSGAASPVRYDLIYPLVAGRGSYPQIVQEEILTSLRENPPRFLVIPSGDMVALKSSLTSTALQTLHQIVQIASTNFRLVHTDGDLLIYERLPQAPAVASSSTRLPFAVRTQPPSAHHCKI